MYKFFTFINALTILAISTEYTPVPDSVIEAKRMRDSTEIYLDPRQQVLGGFETPSGIASTSLSAAREKVCSI